MVYKAGSLTRTSSLTSVVLKLIVLDDTHEGATAMPPKKEEISVALRKAIWAANCYPSSKNARTIDEEKLMELLTLWIVKHDMQVHMAGYNLGKEERNAKDDRKTNA